MSNGLNVSIMGADDLIRYATPSTDLERSLFEALKQLWDDKEKVLDDGYEEANRLEKELEEANERIEELEGELEELKDKIFTLEEGLKNE